MNRDAIKIKVRETLNPYLGRFRRKQLLNTQFTIISNNCWAGHVYRYYHLPYDTPTIGLYFFSEDYIKFIYNLRHYMDAELRFIKYTDSKYSEEIVKSHQEEVPIGRLDDIEIVFLHYHSEKEAKEKWNRRKLRIHWDNLYFKMSEQNQCSLEHLKAFDRLDTSKKFVFVSKNYELTSQILFKDSDSMGGGVSNDTTEFRRFISLTNWLNGKPFKLRQ